MQNKSYTLLNAVTATGAGAAVEAELFDELSFQSSGTFVATVKIQASIDGTTWADIGDVSTSGAIVSTSVAAYNKVRANVTAYTSGSITVTMLGRDE